MKAVAVLLALWATPAWAVEIPKVDVDVSCRNAIRSVGDTEKRSPEAQFQDCFDAAQANYDRLRAIWPQVESTDQGLCLAFELSVRLHHHHAYRDLVRCSRTALAKSEAASARKEIPAWEFRY